MISYGKIYCISSTGPMLPAYFASAFGETEKKDIIKKPIAMGSACLNASKRTGSVRAGQHV